MIDRTGFYRSAGVFTEPEKVLQFRRGRPPVPESQRRARAAARQKRYRERVRQWVKAGREKLRNPEE